MRSLRKYRIYIDERKKMPHKQLHEISIFEWVVTTIIALWSVTVAFLRREFKDDTTFKRKVYFWFQDFVVSGGTTYIVFMACIGYGLPDTIAVPVAGFIGHKATRFSYLLEKYIEKKLGLIEKDK